MHGGRKHDRIDFDCYRLAHIERGCSLCRITCLACADCVVQPRHDICERILAIAVCLSLITVGAIPVFQHDCYSIMNEGTFKMDSTGYVGIVVGKRDGPD